jgi:large subunit ribosomal protein L24
MHRIFRGSGLSLRFAREELIAMSNTMKVRKGDVVQILSGKDRGKQGRVLEARPKERRVLVENLNVVKRHMRPRVLKDSSRMGQQQISPGGVMDKAAPLSVASVMVVCPTCGRPTRVGIEVREVTGHEPTKVRVCRRADCRQVIDR